MKYISNFERFQQYLDTESTTVYPYKFPDRYFSGKLISLEGAEYYVDEDVYDHIAKCHEVISDLQHACEVAGVDWEAILEAEEHDD